MLSARLRFPEMTLIVDRDALQALIRTVEELRLGERKLINVADLEEAGKPKIIELIASNESEVDTYRRSKNRLVLVLSPEAIEMLISKLNEFERYGSLFTPEFYEFYSEPKEATRGKTLRVFLALRKI